ncbi:MAG: T9SS type A sorting domain-containing protein [Bacteroidales bacterium]|nr:T9SS type A sorting domain-containing protein [Bacteroidales bacterium]
MKKFYMILAALLIGSVCFAQKSMTLTEKTLASQSNQTRATGWYGESTLAGYQDLTEGGYFIIRPETYPGATTAGEQVEKIKFYVVSPSQLQGQDATTYASYTNLSFTIKIYEGSAMNADLLDVDGGYTTDNDAVLGTLMRTIPYTATQAGEQIVELSEPYVIGSANYWIALESNGNSLIAVNYTQISNTVTPAQYQGGTYPECTLSDYSGVHYLLYEVDQYLDIDVPLALSYTDQTNSAIALYLMDAYFQIYVQGSSAYVENSDISAGFMDVYPNPTNDHLTSLTIASTQNLVIYPYIMNNGPDAVPTTAAVNVTILVNNVDIFGQAIPMQWNSDFGAGYFSPVQISEDYGITLTPEDLAGFNVSNEFDICMTATYTGVDNNANNNTACLHVTRTTVDVEENIAEAVSVYPNPANDMFTVANAEGATIVVVNSLGQVVASIENAASNQTIDASNFANGTYFVKVNESVVKINVVK